MTEAYAHPQRSPKAIERYAADQARSEIYRTLLHYREQRIRLTGAPKISPRVTSVDEKEDIATIEDCVDDSDWKPVDAKTGKSVAAPGQNHQYRATATLQRLEGRWYVVAAKAHRSQTCSPD